MNTLEFVSDILALKEDKISNHREKSVAIAIALDKFVSEKTKGLEDKIKSLESRLNSLEAEIN